MITKTWSGEDDLDLPSEDHKKYYQCTDIEIASTLVTQGYTLISIVKISQTKAGFMFKKERGIEDVVNGFWTNQVKVSPLEFANARKNLKSRIYAMK